MRDRAGAIITFARSHANAIDSPARSDDIHAPASILAMRTNSITRERAMIDLHYWTTPNGHKITMFLEETGLKYKIFPVNIGKGDQFKPEFLAIAPNNRIPAMVDHEPKGGGKPISVFESGAMLLYLAEKTGKFLPANTPAARGEMLSWLMFVATGIGPYSGQAVHFRHYAPEPKAYAVQRYSYEAQRHWCVFRSL